MAKLPNITEERQVVQAGVNSGISPTQIGISPVTQAFDKLGESLGVAGLAVAREGDKRDKFNYYTAKSNFLRQNIELENKIQNDPDYQNSGTKYTEEVAKIKAGTLGALGNNQYAKHLATDIDLDTAQSLIRVGNGAQKRQEEAARGSLLDTISNNQKSLLETANEGQRAALIHSTNDAIQSALDTGAINEEEAATLRTGFAGDYAENRLNLLSPERQMQVLSPKMGKNGEVFFPKKGNYVDFLRPEKKISAWHNAQAAIKSNINDEVNQIEQVANLGLKVPPESIKALSHKANVMGLTSVAQSLDRFGAVQDQANNFAMKSISDQQVELAQVANDIESGKLKDVDRYSAFANVFKNKTELLKTDPWQYYSAHGVISNPKPIDVSNPSSIGQVLAERRVDSEKVKRIEGSEFNLPLFNKSEIDQLKNISKTQPGERVAPIITAIGNQLRPEEKIALAQQIGNDKESKVLAAAMTLPAEQARDVIVGGNINGEVSAEKVRQSAVSNLAGYILNAETNDSIQEPIYAAYKKYAFDAGNTDKDVDSDILNKAIKSVVGEQVEVSPKFMGAKSKIFSYRDRNGKYISENDLEDKFSSITDETLKKVNGTLPMLPSGDQVSANEILKNTRLITFGEGSYVPYYEGLGMVTYPNGKPYILDMKKIDQYNIWGVPQTEDQVPTAPGTVDQLDLATEKAYAKGLKTVPLSIKKGSVKSTIMPTASLDISDDFIEEGNIDLNNRPIVKNKDGSISTVRSMSFEEDGKEVLVPTVSPDGKILTEDQAIKLYRRTGQHLGKFNSEKAATTYAKKLHSDQKKLYVK